MILFNTFHKLSERGCCMVLNLDIKSVYIDRLFSRFNKESGGLSKPLDEIISTVRAKKIRLVRADSFKNFIYYNSSELKK